MSPHELCEARRVPVIPCAQERAIRGVLFFACVLQVRLHHRLAHPERHGHSGSWEKSAFISEIL